MIYKIKVKTKTLAECKTCHRPEMIDFEDYLQSSEGRHIVFANKEGAEKYIETYTAEGRAKPENFKIEVFAMA